MWRCERIQLQLFYLRWLNALPKVCHRQGRIWNKQKKNPFRLGFSSTGTLFSICVLLKTDEQLNWPGLRLSLCRCCLLTKQAARVLKRTAAARKHMVATTPATTGRARPSSGNSGGGKGSDRTVEHQNLFSDIFWSYYITIRLEKHWPVLETPTTLLLSLIRSSMTAITRNSYQASCQNTRLENADCWQNKAEFAHSNPSVSRLAGWYLSSQDTDMCSDL